MANWSFKNWTSGPRRKRNLAPLFWVFLLLLAASIVILGRVDSPYVRGLQTAVSEFASPILEAARWPFTKLVEGWDTARDIVNARDEIADLRARLLKAEADRETYRRMIAENRRLRGLLGLVAPQSEPVATVRLTGSAGGTFVQNVLVSGGGRAGIEKDMPVVDDRGLVGRIIDAGPWSSRVLLITDFNSRIPVRLETSGAMAILTGQNGPSMLVEHLPPLHRPRAGERMFTSGHGGIFPPDIPIARITKVDGKRVEAEPLAGFGSLDYLRVIRYLPRPKPITAVNTRPQLPEMPLSTQGTAPEVGGAPAVNAVEAPPVNEAGNVVAPLEAPQ